MKVTIEDSRLGIQATNPTNRNKESKVYDRVRTEQEIFEVRR